jgi:hypothetical protein
MSRIRGFLCRLRAARRGSIAVEAALTLPLAMVAVAAFVDVSRYVQLTARADRIAATMADLVARADSIRDRPQFDAASISTDTGVYFDLARTVAEPEDLALGGIVLASITGAAEGATVNWARGDGAAGIASPGRLGAIGPLPVGMPFVVAEVFLPFDPVVLDSHVLFAGVGFDRTIYKRAVFRPRTSTLTRLEPAP